MKSRFRNFLEAVMTGSGIAKPPTDTHDNGGEGDEGNWEYDKLKRFWKLAVDWANRSPAAAQVRFEAAHAVLTGTKPKANALVYPSDQSQRGDRYTIQKYRRGQVALTLTWKSEIGGPVMEAARAMLAKSDLYKAFGEEGRIGSAALLFKGDVLEWIVGLCCSYSPGFSAPSYGGLSSSPYLDKLYKLAISSAGEDRVNDYLKRKVGAAIKYPAAGIVISPEHAFKQPIGKVQSQHEEMVIEFSRHYNFTF